MTTMSSRLSILLIVLICFANGACSSSQTTTMIQGSGATFPGPLYERWFLEYYKQNPHIRTNYQGIGSGAGIRQFSEGLVHFGATDEALSKKKLAEIASELGVHSTEVLQVPLTAGGVALCYNLPQLPKLKLSRQALLGIALGKITYWNHPLISEHNPEISTLYPDQRIQFIRRAESSGTTFIFTSHLMKLPAIKPDQSEEEWTWAKVHKQAGKSVDWPKSMVGGRGNSGVAALIQQTPGAIGYMESGWAQLAIASWALKPSKAEATQKTEDPLAIASLQNKQGQFVQPLSRNLRATLTEVQLNEVFGGSISDPVGKEAYPIVSMTWVVCRKRYPRRSNGVSTANAVRDVLTFCLSDEQQQLSETLNYVSLVRALPQSTVQRIRDSLAQIKDDNENPVVNEGITR